MLEVPDLDILGPMAGGLMIHLTGNYRSFVNSRRNRKSGDIKHLLESRIRPRVFIDAGSRASSTAAASLL
jgi:hypothetical protein